MFQLLGATSIQLCLQASHEEWKLEGCGRPQWNLRMQNKLLAGEGFFNSTPVDVSLNERNLSFSFLAGGPAAYSHLAIRPHPWPLLATSRTVQFGFRSTPTTDASTIVYKCFFFGMFAPARKVPIKRKLFAHPFHGPPSDSMPPRHTQLKFMALLFASTLKTWCAKQNWTVLVYAFGLSVRGRYRRSHKGNCCG